MSSKAIRRRVRRPSFAPPSRSADESASEILPGKAASVGLVPEAGVDLHVRSVRLRVGTRIGSRAQRSCGNAASRSASAPMAGRRLAFMLGEAEAKEGQTMKRKRHIRISALAIATAGVLAGSALASSPPTLTIRHQLRGCHAWSFNGGAYKAALKIRLARGTALKVVDND